MADSGRTVTGGVLVAVLLAAGFSAYALYSERNRVLKEQAARETPEEPMSTPIVATKKDPEAAREFIRQGDLELDANRLNRARYYYYQGALHDQECDRCRAKLQRVETMLYGEIQSALNEGDAAIEQGRFEDAIRAFERVKSLDPGLPNKRGMNYTYASDKIAEAKAAQAAAD